MKKTAIAMLVIAIGCLIWASLQQPLMKLSTPRALDLIEKKYVRSDLAPAEKEQLAFCFDWIRGNQSGAMSAYRTTLMLLCFLTCIVSFQSFWILRQHRRREPIQPPQRNAGSRPSSDDSAASESPSSLGPRG